MLCFFVQFQFLDNLSMQNNISVAMKKLIIIILFSCIFCKLQATIRYVKPVAAGAATGLSWANASASLQSMINISVAGDQIWVAAGTYKPNSYPTGCTSCSGGTARDYTFSLKSNRSESTRLNSSHVD